jgi:hypothetical protein
MAVNAVNILRMRHKMCVRVPRGNQAAADLRLRPRVYRNRLNTILISYLRKSNVKCLSNDAFLQRKLLHWQA